MVRGAFAGGLFCFCWLSACAGKVEDSTDDMGSSVAGSSPTKPAIAPVKACQTYVSTWCTKAFACYVEVGRLNEASRKYNVDQCTKLFTESVPCSAAKSVSGNYQQCLADIKAMPCSKWDLPPEKFATVKEPSSCSGVVAAY